MNALVKTWFTTAMVLLLLASGSGTINRAFAQKTGSPPPWAPAYGFQADTRHIFFPEYNIYFNLETGVYISRNGNRWEESSRLPKNITWIDLRRAEKVELKVDTHAPQRFNPVHRLGYRPSNNRR
jgi:hypothetical protein